MNVPSLVRAVTATLAVWTCSHVSLATAWAIIRIMPSTYRAAHRRVSLRIDQSIQATKPANTERIAVRMSPSITDITRQLIDTIAKMPEKIVRKRQPKKPMTFIKVFDTIAVIYIRFKFGSARRYHPHSRRTPPSQPTRAIS